MAVTTEKHSLDEIESWCDETIPEDRAVLALVAAVRAAKAEREQPCPLRDSEVHRKVGDCKRCAADAALARFVD